MTLCYEMIGALGLGLMVSAAMLGRPLRHLAVACLGAGLFWGALVALVGSGMP